MTARIITLASLIVVALLTGCTQAANGPEGRAVVIDNRIVEASGGQCQFGLEGDGCDLAVRIDRQTYFVDGSSIDDTATPTMSTGCATPSGAPASPAASTTVAFTRRSSNSSRLRMNELRAPHSASSTGSGALSCRRT